MYDSRVMFLVGAGGSIPVKIPGMVGFAEEYAEYAQGRREGEALRELREFGVPPDLEEILQALNTALEFSNQPTNKLVESIISPYASKKAPTDKLREYRSELRTRFREWERLRTSLLKWIRERCLNYDRPTASRIYGTLLSMLAESGYPLFTTNYDPMFHYVSRASGLTLSDNFLPDREGRFFWDPDLNGFHQTNAVRLVHIHGSINWHQFPDGKIERLRSISPKSEEGIPLQEILIFPTRFKDIYDQPFFPLYSGFTRSLEHAEVLYIIGHSLRDEYLLAVIREQLEDGTLLVVIIDPKLPASSVLGSKEIKEHVIHIERGIEKAYPLLIQAMDIKLSLEGQDDSYITEVRRFWESVRGVITKGKLDRISFSDWPVHADPGEELELTLEVDTVFGGETFEVYLCPDNTDLKRPLEFTFFVSESPQFMGRREYTIPMRLKVPEDLERETRHTLVLTLKDTEERVVLEKEYILRILKHPRDALQE